MWSRGPNRQKFLKKAKNPEVFRIFHYRNLGKGLSWRRSMTRRHEEICIFYPLRWPELEAEKLFYEFWWNFFVAIFGTFDLFFGHFGLFFVTFLFSLLSRYLCPHNAAAETKFSYDMNEFQREWMYFSFQHIWLADMWGIPVGNSLLRNSLLSWRSEWWVCRFDFTDLTTAASKFKKYISICISQTQSYDVTIAVFS